MVRRLPRPRDICHLVRLLGRNFLDKSVRHKTPNARRILWGALSVLLSESVLVAAQTAGLNPTQNARLEAPRTSVCKQLSPRDVAESLAAAHSDREAATTALNSATRAWSGLSAGTSLAASGTILTRLGKQLPFAVTVNNSTSRSFTVQSQGGERDVTIANGFAKITSSGKSTYDLPGIGIERFGFLPFLGPLGGQEKKIALVSPYSVDTAHPIIDVYIFSKLPNPQAKGFEISKVRVWIDSATSEITATESCDRASGQMAPGRNTTVDQIAPRGQIVKREFSNYAEQSGVFFPATIKETSNGVTIRTLTITSLSIQPPQTAN